MSRSVETFVVCDFDRTLGDTDKLLGALMAVLAEYPDVDAEALDGAAAASMQRGESFDSAAWVRACLEVAGKAVVWQAIKRDFIALGETTDFLLPGAKELLEYLAQAGVQYGILTYGGKEWQQMKLAAAGLGGVPTIITDATAKGQILKDWQQPDGTFALPAVYASGTTARNIIFIDDKLASFADGPETHITRLHLSNESDDAKAVGIARAKDLYEVLDAVRLLVT